MQVVSLVEVIDVIEGVLINNIICKGLKSIDWILTVHCDEEFFKRVYSEVPNISTKEFQTSSHIVLDMVQYISIGNYKYSVAEISAVKDCVHLACEFIRNMFKSYTPWYEVPIDEKFGVEVVSEFFSLVQEEIKKGNEVGSCIKRNPFGSVAIALGVKYQKGGLFARKGYFVKEISQIVKVYTAGKNSFSTLKPLERDFKTILLVEEKFISSRKK